MKKAFEKPTIYRIELNLTENIAMSMGVTVRTFWTWAHTADWQTCTTYMFGVKDNPSLSLTTADFTTLSYPDSEAIVQSMGYATLATYMDTCDRNKTSQPVGIPEDNQLSLYAPDVYY